MRIILTEQNFKDLVAGEVVQVEAVTGSGMAPDGKFVYGTMKAEIILQDIGWQRMHKIIHDLIMKADHPTLDKKL